MSKRRLTQIITDYFNDKYKSTTYKIISAIICVNPHFITHYDTMLLLYWRRI